MDRDLQPETKPQGEDIQQVVVIKEEVPSEQHEWSPSLDQEDPPEPPHIKEDQEEMWSSQERLEEADITTFPFTPVPVKSEDDKEKPQSKQLHQRHTEHMETGADGEDCGGTQPARNSHPEKTFSCSECGRTFDYKSSLDTHRRMHTGERPFSCSVCGKRFTLKGNVTQHMAIHTGEKRYGCLWCGKQFRCNSLLKIHTRIHTGEKAFRCTICGKRFTQKGHLTGHMLVHTGEKLLNCRVCHQIFTKPYHLKKHKAICHHSSQLHQSQTDEDRETEPQASSISERMDVAADRESACCQFDVQQLVVIKEEVTPEQQEWSPSLDQEDPPEPPHIKEDQDQEDPPETPHIKEDQEGLFTPVLVKSEDVEEKPQSSRLHQRHTEQMETRAADYNVAEIEVSCDDWDPPSAVISLNNNSEDPVRCRSSSCDKTLTIQDKQYSCCECGRSFGFSGNLKKHMRTHTGEKPFSCSVCGKAFRLKAHLTRHMAIHTGQKLLSCSVCEQGFSWEYQIRKHKCSGCPSSQLHQRHTEHMETGADGEDCGGTQPAGNSHPETHLQPETEDQPGDSSETIDRNCDTKETRERLSGLKKAEESSKRSHIGEKTFSCSECGKICSRHWDLKRHMKIHTRDKAFSCPFCAKRFTHKGGVTRHMVVHTGDKPYSCSVCEQRFTWNGQLRKHKAACCLSSQLHQKRAADSSETEDIAGLKSLKKNKISESDNRHNTGEKQHSCSECGKQFNFNVDLKIHMRIHTRERPFVCSVCGTAFARKGSLTQHMVIHTGEKKFSCSGCGKKFRCKSTLNRHMKIHTGVKPFTCSDCGKRFREKAHLTEHMAIHTGQKLLNCRVCHQIFSKPYHLKKHKALCLKSSQLHPNQSEEKKETSGSAEQDSSEVLIAPGQHEWSPHLGKEPPHIKEEQEELWSSQE